MSGRKPAPVSARAASPSGPPALFVTGQLARPALERTLQVAPPALPWTIAALRIKVAALMTTDYIRRTLRPDDGAGVIYIPGLCQADTGALEDHFGRPVRKGPKDLRDLPEFLGGTGEAYDPAGPHDLTILAEINDVHRLTDREVVDAAARYREAGADVIDLGGSPEHPLEDIGRLVRLLRAEGHRVSVDTFDEREALSGDAAGAEFLLSLNTGNMQLAGRIAATPVVIPDAGGGVASLVANVAAARRRGARRVIADAVLEPIPFGFAASLARFTAAREALPDVEFLMGTGNLSELTMADSAGVNALLAGVMAELGIRYALTTEVADWARGSVRELDCARRMMHWAVDRRALPKGYDTRLLTTRDARVRRPGAAEIEDLKARVTDRNFRIETDGEAVYVYNCERLVRVTDIRDALPRLGVDGDGAHAFYLGRELMKADIARRLGKKYIQGEPLDWGYLTWTEKETPHARRS